MENTVRIKMICNKYPVTLLTYCGNDSLNHTTTISEGQFVPERALRHHSGHKKIKNWSAKCQVQNFVFKV